MIPSIPHASLMVALLRDALWQPVLLTLATLLIARLLRPLGPTAHLRLWVSSLVLQCTLPVLSRLPLPALALVHPSTSQAQITVLLGPASPLASSLTAQHLLLGALAAWLLLTLACAARLLHGLRYLVILRRTAQPASLSPAVEHLWQLCCAALPGSQRPTLAVSPRISSPLTLGLRHPVILLPPGLLDTLAEPDLHTLLAHECAHIRRHDFARNLALQVLSLPLALHPATRLTHSRLLEAREWICDAEAARTLAGPRPYASSLLRLAAHLLPVRSTALPAPGLFTRNTLERRIMQLAQTPRPCSRLHRLARFAASAALALGTAATALAFRAPTPTDTSSNRTTTHATPHRVPSGVMAGQSLTKVPPVYPPEAKAAKLEGSVRLNAVIDAQGTIQHLTAVSGPDELRRSALDAVRQWTYKPYLLNGQPTAVETTITVNYSLQP